MSRPRVSRTVAGIPRAVEHGLEGSIASRDEPSNIPVGLYGIRFTLKRCAVEERGERRGLLDRVVDAGEHHVLDEHLAAAQRDVAAALGEHVLERIAIVDRHQLAAERSVGRVQREREADRLLDLVDEARQARAASRPSRSSSGGA